MLIIDTGPIKKLERKQPINKHEIMFGLFVLSCFVFYKAIKIKVTLVGRVKA